MARTPKVVADRRAQILDAAMRVFAQKGFVRATNKDIAREAGITPGLIYHYFDNKEAVFTAIFEERSPLGLIKVLPAEMFTLPVQVFLRQVILRVLSTVEQEEFIQLLHVFVPEMIHNPSLTVNATPFMQQALTFLSQYLQSKMDQQELRQCDPLLTAQVIMSSVIGFFLRRQFLHDEIALNYTHEQIASAIVDTAIQGLLPR